MQLRLRRRSPGAHDVDTGDRRHLRGRFPRDSAAAGEACRAVRRRARRRCASCSPSTSSTFAVLSSGNLSIDPAREQEMLRLHAQHARFVRAAGGTYPADDRRAAEGARASRADDYARLGRLLTELGKRTPSVGVTIVYHHHMNSTGEKPHEVRAVLDAADRRHVRLLFDVAHYQQGGGDPVAAIRAVPRVDRGRAPEGCAADGSGPGGQAAPATSSSSSDAGESICPACSRRCATSSSTSGRSSSSIACRSRDGRRSSRPRSTRTVSASSRGFSRVRGLASATV